MATSSTKPVMVREVWAWNLEFEIWRIHDLLPNYRVVTVDSEFPGTIYKADRNKIFNNPSYNYAFMKANVDELNIIQLGLTLSKEYGKLPDFGSAYSYIWQFNFCDFDIDRDPHDKDSIELLKRQGIDFERNKKEGIDSMEFSRLLWEYDIVSRNAPLVWLTFHGAYDFGYLVQILSRGLELPCDLDSFVEKVKYYLGNRVYDVKSVAMSHRIYGGLEKLATQFGVERLVGESHQAGSDSLLTMQTFMKLQKRYHCSAIGDHMKEFALDFYGLELPKVAERRAIERITRYDKFVKMMNGCPPYKPAKRTC